MQLKLEIIADSPAELMAGLRDTLAGVFIAEDPQAGVAITSQSVPEPVTVETVKTPEEAPAETPEEVPTETPRPKAVTMDDLRLLASGLVDAYPDDKPELGEIVHKYAKRVPDVKAEDFESLWADLMAFKASKEEGGVL